MKLIGVLFTRLGGISRLAFVYRCADGNKKCRIEYSIIYKRIIAALISLEIAEKNKSVESIGEARGILREVVNKLKENET